MQRTRQLKARNIVQDIRSGMTDSELKKKYQLSSKSLVSVLNKLKDAKILEPDEVDSRLFIPSDDVIHEQIRRLPRRRPITKLPIVDLENVELACSVNDMTEKGVQVVGLVTEKGRRKTFLIQAVSQAGVESFSFEAECRWVKTEPEERNLAGFEITRISGEDLEQLRRLIKASTCE